MPESRETPKKNTRKKKGDFALLSGLIVLVSLIAIGLIWFLAFQKPEVEEVTAAVSKEYRSSPEIDSYLKDETYPEEETSPEAVKPSSPPGLTATPTKFLSPYAEPPAVELPGLGLVKAPQETGIGKKEPPDCKNLGKRLNGFFKQVDRKGYLEPFKLGESSQTYFLELVDELLKNPPVVARESDDLFTILRNMAHFFRVIGKDNILIIKTILEREAENVEDVAQELFWFTITQRCDQEVIPLVAPVEKVYEYAGFFISTMGGRSYLFRRDSRSRLLINYYSILIIDLANKSSMNQYGIEINQSISQLINEIESTTQLIYRESYLDKLDELAERYPVIPATPVMAKPLASPEN